MGTAKGQHRITACLIGAAAGLVLQPVFVAAFPVGDPLHPSLVPAGGELAAPDVQDLQHQMGLLGGFASVGPGWTFIPRLTVAETLNDNVLQASSPRRWDLTTLVAPGIAVAADTPRIQLRLDYEPSLQIYARTASNNALTHQLSLVGTATLAPNLLFVDVRGLAGVQAFNGGLGGIGTLGQGGLGPITSTGVGQTNQLGAAKENLYQTTSFAISPYLVHQFGDVGSLRVGLSLTETSLSHLSGFTALPFSTGSDAQQQSSVAETVSFRTGDISSRVRDSITANAEQSRYTGAAAGSSESESFNNRLDYAFDQSLTPYVWLGWERIQYSGSNLLNVNGPQWGLGVVVTPDPDTRIDVSYGRLSGSTSFRFDGRYQISPRTVLTGSYSSGVTTETGLLRSQLNAASVNNNGNLVNNQTGGQLFQANNALGISPGVYRFNTLSLGATAALERDTVTLTLSYSERTTEGSNSTGSSGAVKTAGVAWTHLLNPALALTANAYVSTGTPNGGVGQNSLVAGLSGQYTLSETASAFARYSFYQRESSQSALSMYQDLLLVGVSKQF